MNLSTDLDASVLLFLELEGLSDEQKACEHSYHNEAAFAHAGDAEWYLMLRCPHCGKGSKLYAACDKWVRYLRNSSEGVLCTGGCELGFMAKDWIFTVCERIRK